MVSKENLQIVYLSVSLLSSGCVACNCYLVECCNIVGLMCLFDFWFVKKKEMMLHHVFVLLMVHYMNTHRDITNRDEIISTLLRTEISTIFLTLNNLLQDTSCALILKNVNKLSFVSTFVYYRVYNYSYRLILNPHIHDTFFVYSKNNFEYGEMYVAMYGLYIVNLYWTLLIVQRICFPAVGSNV